MSAHILQTLHDDALHSIVLHVLQNEDGRALRRTCATLRNVVDRISLRLLEEKLEVLSPIALGETCERPLLGKLQTSLRNAITVPTALAERIECSIVKQPGLGTRYHFRGQFPASLKAMASHDGTFKISLMGNVVGTVSYDQKLGMAKLLEETNVNMPVPSDDSSSIQRLLHSWWWQMKGEERKTNGGPVTMLVKVKRWWVKPRSVFVSLPDFSRQPLMDSSLDRLFVNVSPWWDEQLGHFVLRYGGRAKIASVKNVQLLPISAEKEIASEEEEAPVQSAGIMQHHNLDKVSYLLGKVGENSYNCDFKKPFSLLQAFALALILIEPSIAGVTSRSKYKQSTME